MKARRRVKAALTRSIKQQEKQVRDLSPAHHKRILKFVNDAGSPFDLMNTPVLPMSADHEADGCKISSCRVRIA